MEAIYEEGNEDEGILILHFFIGIFTIIIKFLIIIVNEGCCAYYFVWDLLSRLIHVIIFRFFFLMSPFSLLGWNGVGIGGVLCWMCEVVTLFFFLIGALFHTGPMVHSFLLFLNVTLLLEKNGGFSEYDIYFANSTLHA